jgi:sulfur carrier protein
MVPLHPRDITLRCGMTGAKGARYAGGTPSGWGPVGAQGYAEAATLGDNPAMNIVLNGEPRQLPQSATVLDLLQTEQLTERRVAVEVNGEIVTRSLHATRSLEEGDQVEIVHALGGG